MELNEFILFLKCIDGIGDSSIRKMIYNDSFKNLEIKTDSDVLLFLKENRQLLSKKFNLSNVTTETLRKAKEKRQTIMKKLSEIGGNFITWFDNDYPRRFKEMKFTNDFPIILFYKGDISLLNYDKTCSIIGTRVPSNEAIEFGMKIGYKMAQNGYVIISGLALGCDTIGHVSCLDAGGMTVAIMGTGLDKIYPKENAHLAQRILEQGGLLITEELIGFAGASYSFVNRDRLQAASADVVIALETSIDGGTMHASKACIQKYHKVLKVIDPSILPNGKTDGNKELIKYYGAKAIRTIEDI